MDSKNDELPKSRQLVSRAAWESQMKARLERDLRTEGFSRTWGVDIVEVRLEGSYPDTTLSFIYRDPTRPECLFGFCSGTFWDDVEAYAQSRRTRWDEDDLSALNVTIANFAEALIDQPANCVAGEITWFAQEFATVQDASAAVPWRLLVPSHLPESSEITKVTYHPASRHSSEYIVLLIRHRHAERDTWLRESADPPSGLPGAPWYPATLASGKVHLFVEPNAIANAYVFRFGVHVLVKSDMNVESVVAMAEALRPAG